METQISFPSTDGVTLTGDVSVPDDPIGAAIVCHPHPQYGGNRFNPVVEAVHAALPRIGVASLRFDFRQVFDNGVGEADDAAAALDAVRSRCPAVPVFAVGYSFGAMMAMLLPGSLDGRALIAPPLAMAPADFSLDDAAIVLTPNNDQFSAPEVARPVVAQWPDTEFVEVTDADHFLAGHTTGVATTVTEWITRRLNS